MKKDRLPLEVSEPSAAFERLAEKSRSRGERSLIFYNPCVDSPSDCCNTTGLSHRQSNLACAVSIAMLAGRVLLVEELPQAQKHTRCKQPLTLRWQSIYDLRAIRTENGVRIRTEEQGVLGSKPLSFQPRALLTPLDQMNVSTRVEVVDSVPRAVASRAALVVVISGIKWCAPFHLCHHSKLHRKVQAATPHGFLHLRPKLAVRDAIDRAISMIGTLNFTGASTPSPRTLH